ncbi:F-box domain-containing protein [Colletotrichum orchidophilum]|uniref:F-box domain-containing protein n=1 Tax=Colletotrichum orchidophilum TaxID=1209926 RepID=A0A1G4BAU6_9PEZI|nr:F-box domain-containing protein [Colletotrichum orchidophilum]OHE98455.1 F-box domain-containing protein [Colletotrichum orchidophilum]
MTTQPNNLSQLHGHGYHVSDQLPAAKKLPVEILQDIYSLLDPYDFNSSRHTCRSWFLAGMNENVLIRMLMRGGWTSSINIILDSAQGSDNASKPISSRASIMSKWLARECTLSSRHNGGEPAFVELSQTQFMDLVDTGPTSETDRETVVYTANIFQDISRFDNLSELVDRQVEDQWVHWGPTPSPTLRALFQAMDSGLDDAENPMEAPKYPIDIHGQVVAVCSGIVDLSIGIGPEMMIWAFDKEGLARCWALNTGNTRPMQRDVILRDGSMREVDGDGDVVMTQADSDFPPT